MEWGVGRGESGWGVCAGTGDGEGPGLGSINSHWLVPI